MYRFQINKNKNKISPLKNHNRWTKSGPPNQSKILIVKKAQNTLGAQRNFQCKKNNSKSHRITKNENFTESFTRLETRKTGERGTLECVRNNNKNVDVRRNTCCLVGGSCLTEVVSDGTLALHLPPGLGADDGAGRSSVMGGVWVLDWVFLGFCLM